VSVAVDGDELLVLRDVRRARLRCGVLRDSHVATGGPCLTRSRR
jgi:hypothetical protein